MSMPNIPNVKPEIEIDKEQLIDLLLGSIAFEELGLAHMINAGAEEIQFILGTLENSIPQEPPTLSELLEINKSVDHVMRKAIEKEMLLEFKLEDIAEITKIVSSTSTHTTTSTESTTTTTTKKENDIKSLDVSYSEPIYTGSGSNREGSTTVILTFTLSDDSIVIETIELSGIDATISVDYVYTIGNSDVTVMITVTTEGTNNNMYITNVTAEII
jgi:hypothetical protein